jgi:alkylation response protein AidB-like acyl-CoA dehydrogenase
MDALLTDEQNDLRLTAASLGRDVGTTTVSELDDGDPDRTWTLLSQSGFLGLREPEASGSPSASGVDVAVVTEQLAVSLVRAPFLGCGVLAAELARLAGADDVLAQISAGERKVTVCFSRDLTELATGTSEPAIGFDAGGCDAALALRGGDLVLLELAKPASPCIDLTRQVAEIGEAAPGDVVGRLGPDGLERWTALALTALTADLVGTMQGALSLATRYAAEREQFGAAIGSFQAIAHLCAEQAVRVASARSTMNYAAWCVDESPAEALAAARVAKAYASESARIVTEAAIQVHGGIGITWECLAHLYLRRALMTSAVLGDDGYQLGQLAAAAQEVSTDGLS